MKFYNNKNNKGITIISLVVTIIILIILAGIGINLLVRENGIMAKAKAAKEMQKIAEITDRLEVEKVNKAAEKEDTAIYIDEYLDYIKSKDIIEDKDIEETEDSRQKFIVVEDEYIYLVEEEDNLNIKITYQGKVSERKPQILNIEITSTTNSITAKVNTKYAEGGTYKFYIKDSEEGEYGKEAKEGDESTYTFEGLKQGQKYYIKVVVIAKNKQESSSEVSATTGLVENITGAKGKPSTWTNGDVTVELPTDNRFKTEYQIGDKIDTSENAVWNRYSNKFTVSSNTNVYYRYNDGTNAGKLETLTINNIDKTAPTIVENLSHNGVTTKDFNLNIKIKDEESGIGKVIWYYKLSTANGYTQKEVIYKELNGAQPGETTEQLLSLSLNDMTNGTYKAYAEVYNVAGGMTKSDEATITLTAVSTASGASASPTNWTKDNVTVELPKSNGFTTQYQTGSSVNVNGNWNTYNNTFTVESNTKVFYRYNDGTNAGSYGTLTISNIDKTAPTIVENLSHNGVTTKDFNLNIKIKDEESGIGKVIWYYKLSTANGYTQKEVIYKELNGAQPGETTEQLLSLSLNDMTNGTYKAYAEVYNVAGGMTKSDEATITLTAVSTASGASASPTNWTKDNVTVTLPKSTGFTTQYQTGSTVNVNGTWNTYNNTFTVESNTKVFYRYNDGTNAGSYGTLTISNIDKTAPTINKQLYSSDVTTKGFKLNIDIIDGESGISKIIWYYKLSSASGYTTKEDVYTTMNQATAGTTTAVSKNQTFNSLAAGTYKAYAEVYNVAGGMTKSDEATITLTAVSTASGASASPTNWTKDNVTVTLPKSTGFTTQYQTGSTVNVNGTWNTYNNTFTVESNTKVFYRYYDGTNAGNYETLTISNIDKSKPTIGSATGSTQTGNTGTVTVNNIADVGSGLEGIYISTSNSTPTAETSGWEDNTSASYTKTVSSNETYYVWVKDGVGNVSDVKTCTVSGIVAKVTKVTLTDAKVDAGSTVTIEKSITGSNSYKSIAFTSSNTAVATIESGTGVATGVSGGTTTITCTVTNYDGSQVSGTCTLTVEDGEYLIKDYNIVGDYFWQNSSGVEQKNEPGFTKVCTTSGSGTGTRRIPIKSEWIGKTMYIDFEYAVSYTCSQIKGVSSNSLKITLRSSTGNNSVLSTVYNESVAGSFSKLLENVDGSITGGGISDVFSRSAVIPSDCKYMYFVISLDPDDDSTGGTGIIIIKNLYFKDTELPPRELL